MYCLSRLIIKAVVSAAIYAAFLSSQTLQISTSYCSTYMFYGSNRGCWFVDRVLAQSSLAYRLFYSLYFILVQLTLLCLVVYGSTVSAPRALICCPFSFRMFLYSFVLFSLHCVNGINKVMMMMMK